MKYLGLYFTGITGKVGLTKTLRKFYLQFNSIVSVHVKGSYEMNAIHLVKTYCLPTLNYGCENAVFCENTKLKINVTWNNCFRNIFNCCWCERVKPLQYFCGALPVTRHIDQNKLLVWKKM